VGSRQPGVLCQGSSIGGLSLPVIMKRWELFYASVYRPGDGLSKPRGQSKSLPVSEPPKPPPQLIEIVLAWNRGDGS
jgi:hypothetical protein